jgi:hypothetical protein
MKGQVGRCRVHAARYMLWAARRARAELVACGVLLAMCGTQIATAGNIDSPAEPEADAGRMYTLKQIYDVASGNVAVWPAKPSGGFQEPSLGPGSTMHTLDDIQEKIAAGVTTAVAGDILDSKTALTRGAGTGELLVTGTMTDRTGDDVASTAQAAEAGVNYFTADSGYYDGTARVSATDAQVAALDADITAGNIKDTINIFGVVGTYTGGGGGAQGLPKTGQSTSYVANDDAAYANPTGGDIGLQQGETSWAN